eukprot:TRINITY_DN2572_c0_g1_i1.p1 TRINITY_DN2572_c0_g1~~TRINITY_DN2572_c0_g1_i1.p1  ORF type:complete len:420 (-),score=53.14 TRINITY_DN2572_c0_g1_i1:4-1263(-)
MGIIRMEEAKLHYVKGMEDSLRTDILRDKKGITEVRQITDIPGRGKRFEVLDNKGQVAYIIRQHHIKKDKGGDGIKENAVKEWELSKFLCKYTSYVGEIVDVRSIEAIEKSDESADVITEILLKYEGVDILGYRQQRKMNSTDLLHVVFQSALAIAAAHKQEVFHCYLMPTNMKFKDGLLKLEDFSLSSKLDREDLVKKYHFFMTSKVIRTNQSYCPPEVVNYEPTHKFLPISPGKIDVYGWGMTMLHFLTNMSEVELGKYTVPLKKSSVDCSEMLKKIEQIRVPELEAKTCLSLMRLICKSLQYSPTSRVSINEVLTCLNDPTGEYKEIMDALTIDMRDIYSQQIRDVKRKQIEVPVQPSDIALEIEPIFCYPTLLDQPFERSGVELAKEIREPATPKIWTKTPKKKKKKKKKKSTLR